MSIAHYGTLTILALFALCLGTLVLAAAAASRRTERLIAASVRGIEAVAMLAMFASALMIYAFLADDFSIRYVQSNSDVAMPLFYKITAFWGGLDGSLLFWVLLLSLFSAKAVRDNQFRHRSMIAWVIVVLAAIDLFFVSLVVFVKNPFEPFLLEATMDGRGMNPLLQNAYMVVHPPSLYLGYVSLAVPYAFGMAAMLSGELDATWQASVRRWTLVSWLFLTIGLILGGLWAYEELGWGGYWAWDPVENAGLLPWLTATAFLHSVMIQERRGMLRVWNLSLVIMSFWLSIMGTFLTRSGVVQSVHAFGKDPVMTWLFGSLLIAILVVSFGLLIWRLPFLRSRSQLESLLSREFAFLFNNWLFLSMALFVLGTTLYPTMSEWWGERIRIRESHYNHYMVPAGLALLFTTGVGPLLAWRKSTRENLIAQFLKPAIAGIVSVVLAAILTGASDSFYGMACFGLCGFTGATIVQEFWRGLAVANRGRGLGGLLDASIRLVLRARRRYGGYLVHLGIVMLFLGWAGKSYGVDRSLLMKPGETAELGRYSVVFDALEVSEDWQKEMVTAHLSIWNGEERVDTLSPARWWYFKYPDQPTTEVSRYMNAAEDVYASMLNADVATSEVSFRLFINPLVNWVWVGASVMMFASLICIGTRKNDGDEHE
jgi:cytochrome c-type biogenesis protein CcmF